jgi:hypothetical protein
MMEWWIGGMMEEDAPPGNAEPQLGMGGDGGERPLAATKRNIEHRTSNIEGRMEGVFHLSGVELDGNSQNAWC